MDISREGTYYLKLGLFKPGCTSHALGEAPPGCHYAKLDLSVVPGFGKDGEKGKMKEGL
jgi:hypothetical protein